MNKLFSLYFKLMLIILIILHNIYYALLCDICVGKDRFSSNVLQEIYFWGLLIECNDLYPILGFGKGLHSIKRSSI